MPLPVISTGNHGYNSKESFNYLFALSGSLGDLSPAKKGLLNLSMLAGSPPTGTHRHRYTDTDRHTDTDTQTHTFYPSSRTLQFDVFNLYSVNRLPDWLWWCFSNLTPMVPGDMKFTFSLMNFRPFVHQVCFFLPIAFLYSLCGLQDFGYTALKKSKGWSRKTVNRTQHQLVHLWKHSSYEPLSQHIHAVIVYIWHMFANISMQLSWIESTDVCF